MIPQAAELATGVPFAAGRTKARRRVRTESRELTLIAVTVGCALLVGAYDHGFLALQNLRFMLLNCIVLSLVALGQTMVIATRGIDLSVAPVLGLSALATGLMAQGGHLPIAAALVIALAIGLVLGTLNGILVAKLAIPPIITTLGTYSLYSGLMFLISSGTQVNQVPQDFARFGNGVVSGLVPIPIPVIVLGVVLFVVWATMSRTPFGRAILAVGNNAVAAYNAGIAVTRTRIAVYTASGVLASLAGLMFVCYTGSATVATGTGDHIELQSIAVALIGGTMISGGRANVVGSVLGALFLSVVLTALVFVRIPPIWYSAGEGLMILATVTGGARLRRSGAGR